MNNSLRTQIEVSFFFKRVTKKTKNVCGDVSSLCVSVAVVIGVSWCSTIYLNMIKKEVYNNRLPHVCSLCIYIRWFAKKKESQWEKWTFLSHLPVPTPAAAHGFQRSIWLNNVTVVLYITLWLENEACCVLLVCEAHSQTLRCFLFSPHCSFSRGCSLTASSENHLLLFILTKHGSVLEQYQAVIFDVHSLQLDLFKSLCFRLGGYHGNSALQVYLSLCL